MQRKGTTVGEAIVETRDVARALSRSKRLASEEEKLLRMRHGVGVELDRPLARHGEGNPDVQDELLVMELELLRAYKAHLQQQAAARARAETQPSRTKAKIVRALRRMK